MSSTLCHSRQPPFGRWSAHCRANHLFRTSRPAAVFPWLLDRDRQVVSALVVPLGGARWAASHPVSADLPLHFDVVQNPELTRFRLEILWTFRSVRVLSEFLRNRFPFNRAPQVLFLHFPNPLQIRELIL